MSGRNRMPQGLCDGPMPIVHRGPGPLPPHPAILEEELEIQHHDIQRIVADNGHVVEENISLQRELTAVKGGQIIPNVHADRESGARDLIDRGIKLEAELRETEPLRADVSYLRAEVQKLNSLRQELPSQVQTLDWMPHLLREWRSLEGIPSTYEAGESSRTSSPIPLTGEPMELTVPTLVAVIRTLFRISSDMSEDIRKLQSDTSRLNGYVASMYERLDFVESHRTVDRKIVDAMRVRVEVLERRLWITGFVVGVCVMMAMFRTAVGMYLPNFR